MAVPKVLMITHANPFGNGVGRLFLDQILPAYPSGSMLCYSLVANKPRTSTTDWAGCQTFVRQIETSRFPFAATYYEWKFCSREMRRRVDEIKSILNKENIDIIWAFPGSIDIIRLLRLLIDEVAIPLVCTVWDFPQLFLQHRFLRGATSKSILNDFAAILQRAERVSVMSERARALLRRDHNVDSMIWTHALPERDWHERNPDPPPQDRLTIGFAGSLYAKAEWNSLVTAVSRSDWTIAGREVDIRFVGRFPRMNARSNPRVHKEGNKSLAETVEILSSVDVLYLPYWFNPRFSCAVQTSFPSKLTAYAAAGPPILYHGPAESSVSDFLATYPLGLACHSLERRAILDTLERLATDREMLVRVQQARRAAMRADLSLGLMLVRFAQLMQADPQELNLEAGVANLVVEGISR